MKKTVKFLSHNANWLFSGFSLSLMSSFGQTFFISLFALEIMSTYGLSNGQWGMVYAIGTSLSAATMVYLGGLADDIRTRILAPIVMLGLSFAMILMVLNPYVWGVIIVIYLLRLMGQGMATHIASVSMARWFSAQRGRALAISGLGFSLGESCLPIIFVALLGRVDWKLLWLIAAVFPIIIAAYLWISLKKERSPQSFAQTDQSLGMKQMHWNRAQVLRSSIFWFVIPGILGLPAAGTILFFQQVNFAQLKGWDHFEMVQWYPIFTALAVLVSIFSGILVDRFAARRLFAFYQVPCVLGFFLIAHAQGLGHFGIGLGVLAISAGANGTIPTAFWAECFGTAYLGRIKSLFTAIMVLGSALGPMVSGILLDFDVDLSRQYSWIALYFAVATVFMVCAVYVANRGFNSSAGLDNVRTL